MKHAVRMCIDFANDGAAGVERWLNGYPSSWRVASVFYVGPYPTVYAVFEVPDDTILDTEEAP